MSLLLSPHPSLFLYICPKFIVKSPIPSSIFFSPKIRSKFPTRSTYNFSFNDPTDPSSKPDISSDSGPENPSIVDEWGEKSGPEPEPTSKLIGTDPPIDDDEWGGSAVISGNGSPVVNEEAGGNVVEEERLRELKRALVDTVYGSDLGFRASAEVRAETLELVSQLETANPNSSPVECPELLDGNWVLVFTAFSELLPLLAAGSIPFVKVEKIGQSIDTRSLTIENSTTLSTPTSTLSFSASASFEIRSPSRIQVEFKEGSFNPPEIKSSVDLPENINIFGQNINLSSVQQLLNPLQNSVAGIARAISGQSPLRIPIRGGQTKSWLLTTYLDKDLRISRGDGGLFVLVKEGSPLLD
ncbi:plastoglobulin-1, chloroplastic-like [Primulina tabacum]|uniref:plastoglobulin-1, chloroplastic-like n=1 Tax=Primulina tabacum TaxID=48773 RepID=UPI003F5A3F3A